jgi:phospholipase C
MSIKRRTILKGGAAGLAAAALPGCKDGGSGDSGLREAGIDHVIVLMMENRSFDHYLGALKLEEGRDCAGLDGSESNPDAEGVQHSVFHLAEECQEDPPHGWSSSHSQFNEGANDGFVLEHEERTVDQAPWVMGYYNRDDLPIHYALADSYCLPDQFFCSVMGPTWPNRLYGHSGSSDGEKGNDTSAAPFEMRTVYQALVEAGLDWRYYYTDVPFLGLFADHWDETRIGFVEEFLDACERGDLPEFTWVDPGFAYNDDHPPHHVGLGQMFVGLVVEALARSPLWERCLLVITYDEHGGFHDHVPPPKTQDDRAEQGFDQLGFRVPALVVGPWVKTGTVSTVFDNTSVLKYVCERFGLEPWTARIAAANSLGECLDAERMDARVPLDPPMLPVFDVPEESIGEDCNYDFRRDGYVSGQPDLELFVRQTRPETDRSAEIPEIHARLLAKAREWGLAT